MDDNKKPGARDISDLKARLGLKKTGTMATVNPGAENAGGTAAPHAPGSAAAIPAPFGQPAAAAPVAAASAAPPDPRRDPFATQQAANLAAFYGYGQALPGSDDGTASGPMEKKKPWGMIGGLVGAGLAVFIVGSFWGGISKTRVEFNETTDHAVLIRNEVEKLQKNLESILGEMRKPAPTPGKPDIDQATRLGALNLQKPNTTVLFHTNYVHLEGLGMERLFAYYNDTIKLYDEINQHKAKTEHDKEAINKFLEAAAKSDKNYGVVIDAGGPIPIATFAEMGTPVCPTAGQVDCAAGELKGFKYRLDAGSAWSEKPVKGKMGETVTPLKQTPLFKSVAAGSPDSVALAAYNARQKNILELIGSLEKTQKELMSDLKKTAERPKVFTF